MSKCRTCWQVGKAYKDMKRQALLEQTIEDAGNTAKKDGFTGFIVIYPRDTTLGFSFFKEDDKSRPIDKRPVKHLYFDNGASAY